MPPCFVPEAPGFLGRAVRALDVTGHPLDLIVGVRLPVRPGTGHFVARQSLRNPVRAAGIGRCDAPATLVLPHREKTAVLRLGVESERRKQLVGDGLCGAGARDGRGIDRGAASPASAASGRWRGGYRPDLGRAAHLEALGSCDPEGPVLALILERDTGP